jgi:hypothetical protein
VRHDNKKDGWDLGATAHGKAVIGGGVASFR